MKRNVESMYKSKMLMLDYYKNYLQAIEKLANKDLNNNENNCLTKEENLTVSCYLNNNDSILVKTKRR